MVQYRLPYDYDTLVIYPQTAFARPFKPRYSYAQWLHIIFDTYGSQHLYANTPPLWTSAATVAYVVSIWYHKNQTVE